jgi:type IV pilus assembly protein PilV
VNTTVRRLRQHTRGVSLIEVLVSIVILTFGLMGAAALQGRALKNNQSSYEHAQMSIVAHSMLDSMRANMAEVNSGAYEMPNWTCVAPTGGTLAATDSAAWINSLQTQINPSACGRVTCTGTDCLVGIRWDDSRGTAGSASQTFELRSRL